MVTKEKSPLIAANNQAGRIKNTSTIAPIRQDAQLDRALAYASQGIPVFPLHTPLLHGAEPKCSCGNRECTNIGKHPRTRKGLYDATTDAALIRKWWSMWPEANIGMPTGIVSGMVVLDVDNRDSLAAFEEEHGLLPDGPVALTGSGGLHLYFRAPGDTVPNSASKIGPGLDIRGDGGYVVLPPSLHASGHRYRWLEGRPSNAAKG